MGRDLPVGGMRVPPAGLRLKYPSRAVGVKKILSVNAGDHEPLRPQGAGDMPLAMVRITIEYLREMHHPGDIACEKSPQAKSCWYWNCMRRCCS